MKILEPPVVEYIGDKYQQGFAEKVCIDYSKQKIRVSLIKIKNHPNVKKQQQREVVWFKFADVGRLIKVYDP